MKTFKLITLIVTALAFLSFGVDAYLGRQVSAVYPMVWIALVFINDLQEYLASKF